MAAIEGADADREGKVERFLAGQQYQLFGADLTEAHPAGSDLRGSLPARLRDRLGGAVDRENVAGPEPRGDGARRLPSTRPVIRGPAPPRRRPPSP